MLSKRWALICGLLLAILALVLALPYALSAYHLQAGGRALERALGRRDAIEWWYVGPREVRDETLPRLRELGFNRVSLGVQDFNPAVQEAVHRVQTAEQTLGAMRQARELGFRSINIDLMYGLPLQTETSFSDTLL